MKNKACNIFIAAVWIVASAHIFSQYVTADSELVTITYVDGHLEKGIVVVQNVDKVVLRVIEGNNHLDIPVPWSKISKISNGLTHASVVETWKLENKDRLCPECAGDRVVPCKKCLGGGLMARALISCAACKGTGSGKCPAKGCENGQVPCPGKCMKLYEGKWVKGKDDLLWHRFYTKGSWVDWNERHCGDVIEVVDNKVVNSGPCPICNRTTRVPCQVCNGKGVGNCALCKGNKEVPQPGPDRKCDVCQGAKTIACPWCKGTGLTR